jgi:uncharacterized YccA/Bax inhibitor family protein
MESRNPVLKREAQYAGFHEPGATAQGATAGAAATDGMSAEQLQELYNQPAATRGPAVKIDDVIVKTVGLFVLLLLTAAVGWVFPAVTFPAMIVGLVLGLVNTFKKSVSPALIMAYALVEGLFVGGISSIFSDQFAEPIVQQAVLGTLVAFGVMLTLYKTRIIKVDGRFQKIMLVALVSYGLIAVASFIAAIFFNTGGGWGFYGVGGLGLLFCVAGVALASFTLMLDFDAIEKSIAMGLPERESWRLAFGLMVTLIWLYIEILRFLAILNSSD